METLPPGQNKKTLRQRGNIGTEAKRKDVTRGGQQTEVDIDRIWYSLDSLLFMVINSLRSSMLNTYYLEKLISASETCLQGVQTLMQGYLPISLIEPAVLRTTIRSISRKLKSKYPLFCIAYSSLFDYYRTPSVLFSHTNNFLYIQLKVPLVHKAGLMHIYRTQSFPIPVENTDPDTYTQIEGIPPYFAVSPDGTHHMLPYPKFNIIHVTLKAVKCVSS